MVNERLKKWRRLVKEGKIDPLLWNIHFQKRPDKCTCRDCFDYKCGECTGGYDPIMCFSK